MSAVVSEVVTCTGCGLEAVDDRYFSESPEGDVLYWVSDCQHEYENGEIVTCECGIRCPNCQTPEERAGQREHSQTDEKEFIGIMFCP